MNVELTIQEMYDQYPTLFKDRADCMNHLFCTIGNGMEWQNGELVTIDEGCRTEEEIRDLKSHLVKGKAFQHNKLSLLDELIYYGIFKSRKDIPDHVLERHLDDQYHRLPRAKRWYFATKQALLGIETTDFSEDFAFLFNYPEDIKHDWLLAIEECRRMIEEDGYTLP